MAWMDPEEHPVDEKVLAELIHCAAMSADDAVFADYEATQAMTGADRSRMVIEAGLRGLVRNGCIDLPSWDELLNRMKDGYAIGRR